nr:radical SAM protein [Alphaproteobacteria bacterium]
AKRNYQCKPIMLGAVTDPYQPIERDWTLTRGVLEELAECGHPVIVTTKSASILRDLDILAPMAAQGLVAVGMSVTTLDRTLARTMEPRASSPGKRLDAIEALTDAGIPVTVMAAPMIPHLNDHELENLLGAAAEKGARSAYYTLLRLPLELKELFADWLAAHAPDRASRVLNGVRETRGGKLYQSDFDSRMRGTGEYAELMEKRFRLAIRKLGLNEREPAQLPLRTDRFRAPILAGSQLALF